MMLRSYVRYLLKRKNAFHIHSPFVYALYTRVVRGGDVSALKTLGIERVETVTGEEIPIGDGTVMFVVEGIHENREREVFWNTICKCPDVQLTIDLYRRGWFFYREGMEKQHFVLRS